MSSDSISSFTPEIALSRPPNSSLLYEPARDMTPLVSLGPIIGLVTATTARVLIETTHPTSVSCFLTEKSGKQFGVKQHFEKGIPGVFQFTGLQAEMHYRVTFDIPVPGLVKAGFHTLPDCWDLSVNSARFATVSSSEHSALRENVEERSDLWKKLYKQASRGQIDYILHLGDNVYVDSNFEKIVSGKKVSAVDREDCAWMKAFDFLADRSPDQWPKCFKEVCEIFRSAYRASWTHPTTRHAMANAPNLMILGRHEIRSGLGLGHDDTQPIDSFLSKCAYEVYNEYQRSLFEHYDFGTSVKAAIAVGQAYHFHCLGDIGIMFLDTVAKATFHRRQQDEANPLFGSRQWKDIEFALRAEGYLSQCKMLIVCCPQAPAWIGDGAVNFHVHKPGMEEMWTSPKNLPEVSMLLCRLFDWRAERPGRREVCIVAGSMHMGSCRTLTDVRYEDDRRLKGMTQLVASPMSINKLPHVQRSQGSNHVGAYHRFNRGKQTTKPNFATIEVFCQRNSKLGSSVTSFATHLEVAH